MAGTLCLRKRRLMFANTLPSTYVFPVRHACGGHCPAFVPANDDIDVVQREQNLGHIVPKDPPERRHAPRGSFHTYACNYIQQDIGWGGLVLIVRTYWVPRTPTSTVVVDAYYDRCGSC